MDLLLDRTTGDLVFRNGECPTTEDRTHGVVQKLYIRLRTFLGEWYLSETYGVPWLERILGHKVNKSTVDMIIQEEILKVDGVDKILSFSSEYLSATRGYKCRFSVQSDEGKRSEEIIIVQ